MATMEAEHEEAGVIQLTRYCPHCRRDRPVAVFSQNPAQCNDCGQRLSAEIARNRQLKETMANFLGNAAKSDGITLARFTAQVTEDIGGIKRASRMFADAMVTAFERYEDNPKSSARSPLDYFKTYMKLVQEHEKQQRDIDAVNNLTDAELSRMIFASVMEDAGDDADDLLRAIAESRGMRLVPEECHVSGPDNEETAGTN